MNTLGLITVAVLSGVLLTTKPEVSEQVKDENVILIDIGKDYVFETDVDVKSVQINPPTAASADLVNSRTIMISGQTVGAGEVIFLNDKRERLFWAKIKVVPRLWEQ